MPDGCRHDWCTGPPDLPDGFVGDGVTETLELMASANNLFDTLAVGAIDDPSIPATGIVRARILNGRPVSATARLAF